MNRTFFFILLTFVLLTIDWYVWQGLRLAIRSLTPVTQRWIGGAYWAFIEMTLIAYVGMQLLPADFFGKTTRTFVIAFIAIPYLSKLFAALILLVDDIRRLFQWILGFIFPSVVPISPETGEPTIPRSEFLASTAVIAGAGLMGTFAFGILSGAHDYKFAV